MDDLRRFLCRTWRLTRRIDDRRSGLRGLVVDGLVVIDTTGYRERGVLRMGSHQGPFFRDYRLRFPARHRAEFRFEDGRPFHDLDLRGGAWSVRHRCGDDLYRGRFTLERGSRLRVQWRVTGPTKDLSILSRLEAVYDRRKDCYRKYRLSCLP